MFEDLLAADEGHPQMGKELKSHVLEAGFENVKASASFGIYSSPQEIELIHRLIESWFLSAEVTEAAIKYGAATERLCNEIRAAYERWKKHPGALIGVAFGEVIANKSTP